ncbi:MAG: hypothetical protein RBS39_06185 [Phycisphaerales bacterium]|jgi:hypothetical protein|nr:hypothetical protein [Phycisphaerales bacterium]
MRQTLTLMLAAVVALNALLSGAGGDGVLCLGGGHRHGPEEVPQCASGCGHEASVLPVRACEHDCGCIDVEFAVVDVLTHPRIDDGGVVGAAIAPAPAWGVMLVASGMEHRGPPVPPPWFDPGRAQRLALVSSVCLIL